MTVESCSASRTAGRHGRLRDQRGSLAVELVVLSPIIVLFGLVGLGLGRYEVVRSQVVDAAHSGAEAAAATPDGANAPAAAVAAVLPALQQDQHDCPDPQVMTDTSAFRPGGSVEVTVVCAVPTSELSLVGLGGSLTVVAASSLPIDTYRSVG